MIGKVLILWNQSNQIMLDPWLEKKLKERESAHLLRKLTNTKGLIDFTSNDYLGLARSKELFDNITERVTQLGFLQNGAGGSRLLSGNSHYAEEVEEKMAGIFSARSALIFNSGYSANLAVLSSLPLRNDTIIYDERAHTCIKDGARLSLARRLSFKHNDLNDLEPKLKKSTGRTYIAVESIYSMDGDVCPLKELINLSEKYHATIILDEAHSTGVVGNQGSGMAVSLGLHERIGIRIYTFGKAMGVHGACVAGSTTLRSYLINFARPFIYTTALPPHSLVAIESAFEYLAQHIGLQQVLHDKIQRYSEAARAFSQDSVRNTSIQSVIIGGNEETRRAADRLQLQGFDVRPILSPTVAQGSERLRVCLHTFNEDEQITRLTEALKELIPTHKDYLTP